MAKFLSKQIRIKHTYLLLNLLALAVLISENYDSTFRIYICAFRLFFYSIGRADHHKKYYKHIVTYLSLCKLKISVGNFIKKFTIRKSEFIKQNTIKYFKKWCELKTELKDSFKLLKSYSSNSCWKIKIIFCFVFSNNFLNIWTFSNWFAALFSPCGCLVAMVSGPHFPSFPHMKFNSPPSSNALPLLEALWRAT